MANFAEVDDTNTVLRVIVAEQDYINTGALGEPSRWLLSAEVDGEYRYNSAGSGYTYSPTDDAFIPPKPFKGWVLDTNTFTWHPPTPKPRLGWVEPEGYFNFYAWDESVLDWSLQTHKIVGVEESSGTTEGSSYEPDCPESPSL